MENKIIENNKNGDNNFFEIEINRKDKDMAEKYQELYDYLVKDENGIKHDLDKLKKDYPADNGLLVCSIFAVNFWCKKEKGKQEDKNDFCLLNDNDEEKDVININEIDNNNKIDKKANEIKRMMETLDYNIKSYDIKTQSSGYDWDIQKQIDSVSSIEKIFGAFMNVNPELFDIKKFDDFMSMSNEDYAEFYNVIWASKSLSELKITDKYRTFLNNNKVLDEQTERDSQNRNLSKMNLALNESDLEKIEARIEQISKLEYYITSLDCAFTKDKFDSIKEKIPEGDGIIGLLKCGKEELLSKYNEFKQNYVKLSNEKENVDPQLLESNYKLSNLYTAFYNMKKNIDDISKSISNLKNPQAEEIKNNLEEKILWNNECTIEKREDFFKITTTVDEMREKYKKHMDFVKEKSIFADLQKPIDDVVQRFSDVNPDLQLKGKKDEGDKKEVTVEDELRNKYKDVHVATFAVNHFHKDNEINNDQKIDESIAMMHTLEINEDGATKDLNKAACIIEKIFLAFIDVDIKAFDIKKFDAFVGMKPETYMEFIEIVTAAIHAYKFIEKYQKFINMNEDIDKTIEKMKKALEKCALPFKIICETGDEIIYSTEKELEDAITDRKQLKINLALSKSDFEKVKKRIDKISGFAEWFYALSSMLKNAEDNIINDYYGYLEKTNEKHALEYFDFDNDKKNEELNNFLESSLTKNFDELKLLWSNAGGCLSSLFYWLMCLKKKISNMLLDPKKFQIEEETINKLKNKINEQENVNADKLNEKNIQLIKDSYKKIEEDVFSEKYGSYGYGDVVEDFVKNGESIAWKAIDENKGAIAQEYVEFEKKSAEKKINEKQEQIERFKQAHEKCDETEADLNKLKRKIDRIGKFNDEKDGVPKIVVEDKYFNEEFEEVQGNEELYPGDKIDLFDQFDNLLIKQKTNTCYLMSILIGLIAMGMDGYIRKNIIRQDETDKTKAIVRLFDENGCPVDFVVDKTKFKSDTRPLWISVFEKAASVMMNNTNFEFKEKQNNMNGGQIVNDIDWRELAKKQQNKEKIFDEKAFSRSCIANGNEKTGIQMIFGKTSVRRETGNPNRKIKYAKEGDEALGFIKTALEKNKLVLASTYHNCNNAKCEKCKDHPEIPHGDRIHFDYGFKIPAYHVVCIKSINFKYKEIEIIESIAGKHTVSFSQFKKHFSDVCVTDFPEEAEKIKKQEKIEKEANKIIDILNQCEKDTTDLKLTEQGKSLEKMDNDLKSLQDQIKQNHDNLNKTKDNFCKEAKDRIEKLGPDISKLKEITEKKASEIKVQNDNFNNTAKNTIQNLSGQISEFQKQIKGNENALNIAKQSINEKRNLFIKQTNESEENIKSLITNIEGDLNIENIQSLNLDELYSKQTLINSTVTNNIQDLKEGLENIQTQILDIVSKMENIKTNLEQRVINDNTINTTKQKLNDQILKAIKSCETEVEKLGELEDYSKKQKELESSIKELIKKISDYKQKISTIEENISMLTQNEGNIKNNINKYSDTLKKANEKLNQLNQAKKKLEELKNNQDTTSDLKNKIEKKLNELQSNISNIEIQINTNLEQLKKLETDLKNSDDNIKKLDYAKKDFQVQINTNSKQLKKLEDALKNSDDNIKEFDYAKKDFQVQINTNSKQLKKLEDALKNSDDNIKEFDNAKKDFQTQINTNLEQLKKLETDLKNSDDNIKKLDYAKKDFQVQINTNSKQLNELEINLENSDDNIEKSNDTEKKFQIQNTQQFQDKVKSLNKYVEQWTQKLKEIEDKKIDLGNQLSGEIYKKYTTTYATTSNKIKKGGIVITVCGTVGSVCVLIIPNVAIGFIFIPLPMAVIGSVLLAIYFYREKKKPPLPIDVDVIDDTSKNGIIDNVNLIKEKNLNKKILGSVHIKRIENRLSKKEKSDKM